jgi:DNA-binding SARP family transcriptional activator
MKTFAPAEKDLSMQLQEQINRAFDIFKERAGHAKVTLLHPRSRYRSVSVAKLINSSGSPVFYYALGPDDISIQSFLSGITHDIANQQPMFGRHINTLPEEAYSDVEILLDTFARDISELSNEPFYLILDEYDRSDISDEVQMFTEQLIPRLPDHCHLVINSRTLPRLPWVSMIAQGRAVLLEDDRVIADKFYDTPTDGTNQLEVYALGPGFVLLDNKMIDTWEGHLPRLLFFFALDRPVITRSEICQAFWPELDTDQAVNVFHVTKRRLHKALDMDVLVHEDGYYRINPELGVQYDVIDFVSYVMAGRDVNNPDRVAAWQRAIDLYRGPFLQGHGDRWIQDRRRDFRAGYLEALMQMANVRLVEGRPEHALGLFQRALAEDNTHEELHRQIMRLYTTLGRRSEAAAHYMRYADELKRQNREPHPDTAAVYQEIMS